MTPKLLHLLEEVLEELEKHSDINGDGGPNAAERLAQDLRRAIDADGSLIAAAPVMREAIKAALKEPNDRAWDMLRASIAKAEGRS